jgi:hypothetical protein
MATDPDGNACKTSCCVFNYYTQTVYNPNPPRLWSRFNYVCPCPSGQGQVQCSTDFLKLDERRKAEILKYKANSSNITKKQQYANAASNRWLTGRKRSWATQTDTYTNPNTSALQRVGNVLECNNNNVSCSLTSDADVPGKVQSLCYDPTVPLYNYKVTTTYSDGGGKYGLYGRVQVVSLSNFNNITKTFTDPPFDLTPPTSNSPGDFTYTSSNALVATISGITVTIVGLGTCTITATQAAYSNYTSGSISALLTVNKITTTLKDFAFLPPNTKSYSDNSFNLILARSSRLNDTTPITYSSSDSKVATVNKSSGVVTIVGVGSCIFIATQAATVEYSLGIATTKELVVKSANPTIGRFTVATPQNYGAAPIPITKPSSNSQGTFTYSSSNTSVATINVNQNQIIIGNVGECKITAHQAADGRNYSEGTSNEAPFTVNPIPPTISLSLPTVYTNTTPFSLIQYTTSDNPSGTFTYTSKDTSVATINDDKLTLTPVAAGTTIITVHQTANGNYTDGSTPVTLTISLALPNLTWPFTSPQTLVVYPDDSLTLSSPTSNSDGVITLSNANGGDAVGINPTTINPIPGSNPLASSPASFILTGDRVEGVGQVTIVATQAPTNIYAQGIISFVLLIDETLPPDPPDI